MSVSTHLKRISTGGAYLLLPVVILYAIFVLPGAIWPWYPPVAMSIGVAAVWIVLAWGLGAEYYADETDYSIRGPER